MLQKMKFILSDAQFWMIMVTAISLAADAVSEGKVSTFRAFSLVGILILAFARVVSVLSMHARKQVPFAVVIGKSDAEYRVTVDQVRRALEAHHIPVARLLRTFNLYQEDWVYHRESFLPMKRETWRQELGKVQRKFWHLAERIPGRKVYQFFLNGPAAFALGMGALLGSRTEFVFFHFTGAGSQEAYLPIIDLASEENDQRSNLFKIRVNEYLHIRMDGIDTLAEGGKSDVYVGIDIARHILATKVRELGQAQNLPVVVIDSIHKGNISLQANWRRIGQELSHALLEITADARVDRVHLFLSIPVPLAFAIGSALGPFARVSVYNFFTKTEEYREVFRLGEL